MLPGLRLLQLRFILRLRLACLLICEGVSVTSIISIIIIEPVLFYMYFGCCRGPGKISRNRCFPIYGHSEPVAVPWVLDHQPGVDHIGIKYPLSGLVILSSSHLIFSGLVIFLWVPSPEAAAIITSWGLLIVIIISLPKRSVVYVTYPFFVVVESLSAPANPAAVGICPRVLIIDLGQRLHDLVDIVVPV